MLARWLSRFPRSLGKRGSRWQGWCLLGLFGAIVYGVGLLPMLSSDAVNLIRIGLLILFVIASYQLSQR